MLSQERFSLPYYIYVLHKNQPAIMKLHNNLLNINYMMMKFIKEKQLNKVNNKNNKTV
jgi:hypothetical protein